MDNMNKRFYFIMLIIVLAIETGYCQKLKSLPLDFNQHPKAKVENSFFIYSYDNVKTTGKVIDFQLDPRFANVSTLTVDGIEKDINEYKLISARQGYYANVKESSLSKANKFALCVSKKKYNLFQYQTYHTQGEKVYNRHFVRGRKKSYYNQGYKDIKKAKYRYLKHDFAASLELQNIKKNQWTSNAGYIIGSVVAGAGVVLADKSTKNMLPALGLISASLVSFKIAFNANKKNHKLVKVLFEK